MTCFASPGAARYLVDGKPWPVVFVTPRQDTSCHEPNSPPPNSKNSDDSPLDGVKSSPDAPATTPPSNSTSTPWSRSPRPPLPGSSRGRSRTSLSNGPTPSATSSPAPTAGGPVPSDAKPAPCTSGAASGYDTTNPSATVPTAAGTFSPLRPALRLDGHGYSPAVLQQVVTAAARLGSFADAAFAVALTGLSISARHVQQLTHEVGTDLARRRDEQAEKRRRRQPTPRVASTPGAVVVEVDGGRLRTRAADAGRGVHEAHNQEDKIACLATLQSVAAATDPQPEPPPSFVQPRRIQRLVRQMAGCAGEPTDESDAHDEATSDDVPGGVGTVATPAVGEAEDEPWAPRRLVRTCLASMADSRAFGPMLAGEAQARDFYAALRRAFVADGLAYNWAIQQAYFADFVPIVEFLHVICYLYKAGQGLGSDESSRWALYTGWVRACWQGRVCEVVSALAVHQEAVGRPPPGEELAASDVRRVVAEALSYLGNNVGRMDYPRYRRAGLPTTSSLVESLVGEFNARVKSKQKHWNRPDGAEAILPGRE